MASKRWCDYPVPCLSSRAKGLRCNVKLLLPVLCGGLALLMLYLQQLQWQEARSADKLPLFRDLYTQEEWRDIQQTVTYSPDQTPGTVHYVWCGKRQFLFRHYLGLLSAIRLLQPLHVVFHYTHLPVLDSHWYNVWFLELKQSFANLELKPLSSSNQCEPEAMRTTVTSLLSVEGGTFIGENVILTRSPSHIMKKHFYSTIPDGDHLAVVGSEGVVFAQHGFDPSQIDTVSAATFSKGEKCDTVWDYNRLGSVKGSWCVVLDNMNIYPRDIWTNETAFAELARWLYYGERKKLQVKTTEDSSIPRLGHVTWLERDGAGKSRHFRFLHYLSVLSALHVAGLEHVYVHATLPPRGEWWEALQEENVTFVPLHPPTSVFQQRVRSLSHRSDVARVQILQKFGGVYHDLDVVWVSRLPDWLLRYPTVVCPDWPRNGRWPETFNTGVLMSQPRAPWLRHFLSTLRHFLDHSHAFNAVMMSYRAYEAHPDTLYVDRRLQVICFRGICHPAWFKDYIRDINDVTSPVFDWHEGRSFHFTVPKPPSSLTSPTAIAAGSDIFSIIGRHILREAKKEKLLFSS